MKEGTLTICLPTLWSLAARSASRLSQDIPDVALADEDTSVVDGLGETELVDAGLQTALQEVLDLQGQDVIELHAGLVEDTDTHETADEGVTLEETLGVLLVESEERTRHVSNTAWSNLRNCRRRLTGQHDGSWRESTGRARPRACCGDHTRRRASAQYPYPNINQCPRHKRSTLSLSGRGVAHTDERTRKDDGGRCTSWSRIGRPFLLDDDGGEFGERDDFGVAKFSGGPCQAWALLVA
jgi:hypothetical protein